MSLLTRCVVVSSSTSVTATGTSRKSSVAVMKISKRIKEKKRNIPGTRDASASRVLHSHPIIAATPLPPACRLSLWSLCVWKNLVVGGRKNEGSKRQ